MYLSSATYSLAHHQPVADTEGPHEPITASLNWSVSDRDSVEDAQACDSSDQVQPDVTPSNLNHSVAASPPPKGIEGGQPPQQTVDTAVDTAVAAAARSNSTIYIQAPTPPAGFDTPGEHKSPPAAAPQQPPTQPSTQLKPLPPLTVSSAPPTAADKSLSPKKQDAPEPPTSLRRRSLMQFPLAVIFIVQFLIVAAGFAAIIAVTLLNEADLIQQKVDEIISFSMQRNENDILIPLEEQVSSVSRLSVQLQSQNITCRGLNSYNRDDYINTWMALNTVMRNSTVAAFAYEDWQEAGSPRDPLHPEFELWAECGCEQLSQYCGFNRNTTRRSYHGGPAPASFSNSTPVSTILDANPGKAAYVIDSIAGIPQNNTVGRWAKPYVWEVVDTSGSRLTTLYSYYVCMGWNTTTGKCAHSVGIDASLDNIAAIIATFASTPQSTVALIDVSTNLLIAHNGAFPQLDLTTSLPYAADATPSAPINRAVIDLQATCIASASCQLRIRDDGDSIASAFWVTAPNGLSLMIVDVTPRSYHFAKYDENRRVGIIIGVVIPLFVLVVCVLVWLAVSTPLHHIGGLMQRAATMQANHVPRRGKWLYLSEVVMLQEAYEKMHEKLLELRPFVPHYLFVAANTHGTPDNVSVATSAELNDSQQDAVLNPFTDEAGKARSIDMSVNDSTLETSSAGRSTPMMMLGNLSVENLNRFTRNFCTVMYVSFDHNYADLPTLNGDVENGMNLLIDAANNFDGVLDVQRPDSLVVTFGAHHTLASHQSAAASCAIQFLRQMPEDLKGYISIVIDSAEYLVGACGAKHRFSRALFGERYVFMRHIAQRLAIETLHTPLVCTEKTASALTKHVTLPVDIVEARPESPLASFGPVKLFEIVEKKKAYKTPEASNALNVYRDAFSKLLCGDGAGVINTLSPSDFSSFPRINAHKERLMQLGKYLVSHKKQVYERKELIPYETFDVPIMVRPSRQNRRAEQLKLEHLSLHTSAGAERSTNISGDAVVAFVPFMGLESDGPQSPGDARNGGGDDGGALFEMFAPTTSLLDDDDGNDDSGELPLTFDDKHQGVVWTRSKDVLGTGAFASVYRGISSAGTFVALKCIDLSSRHIQAQDVIMEVNIACKLHHENIVNHISWVRHSRYLVIAMEFVPGGSMMSTLETFGPLSLQALRRFALDALNGLAYLHRNHVIHADIKPHNMLVGMDGASKLSDFGSTVYTGSVNGAPTGDGDVFSIRGTALYMAPEVANGDSPTAASDVWSLGITLYQLFTGDYPWVMAPGEAGDVRVLMRKDAFFIQAVAGGKVVPEIKSSIQDPLKDFLLQCLQINPAKRATVTALQKHALFLM